MSGVIGLFRESQNDVPNFQNMAQSVADIAAILGEASHDISKKRRAFIRSSLANEYKAICDSRGSNKLLFGDELSQDIAELNLTNKLKRKATYYPSSTKYKKGYFDNRDSGSRSQDFYKGRGNLPTQNKTYVKRTEKPSSHYNARGKKKQWSKWTGYW